MRKRASQIASLWTAATLGAALAEAGCSAPRDDAPPNVVLLTLDALRADAVGYAGYPFATTPELDARARRGVAFLEAMASHQGTLPSMPSLMSGLFPSFEGIERWTRVTRFGFSELREPGEPAGVPRRLRTLAEILRESGFATAGFNTNPHLNRRWNFHQGFAHYEQFDDFFAAMEGRRRHYLEHFYPPAEQVVDRALAWLATAPEPFFLWVHLMDPHSPYLPPPPYDRAFPGRYSAASDLEINEALYNLLSAQAGQPSRPGFATVAQLGLRQPEFAEHLRALYDGSIRYADAQAGRLLGALERRGLLARSAVVVTADHGEEFFDHGFVIHHRLTPAPEELLRIPLLVLPPARAGARTPQRAEALVRMVDVAPTLLDLAGHADAAAHMDGVSLRPLLRGGSLPPLVAFVSAVDFGVARSRRWKYRVTPDAERLYAIDRDPLETRDVAALHPEPLAEMRRVWTAFAAGLRARAAASAHAPPEPVALDPALRRRLEALGYVGEE